METGIPADVWRFYIFYNRPEKSDTLFTWKDFQEKVNGELIGNLGNLVNRTLSFVSRYYDGKMPEGQGNEEFWKTIRKSEEEIAAALERADLRDAFHLIFELSSFANKTFQDGEPWKKRQGDSADQQKAKALIRDLSYVVRDIAVMIQPFMPQAAEQIASFFDLSFGGDLVFKKGQGKLSWDDIGKDTGLEGVVKSEVLFSKLEDDKIAELRERYSGSQKERATSGSMAETSVSVPGPTESLDIRFAKTIDLRVAQIVKIERHPKAEKLYIETLKTAPDSQEERIIVSGLVPFFKEEELLNKKIILANNLKPAKLRGVESKGMLLAAEDHKGPPDAEGNGTMRVEVLDGGDAPVGTRVMVEGLQSMETEIAAEIDIDTFFSIPMEVKDSVVTVGGKALTLEGRPIRTKIVSQGNVQ
jgi:methionyl-tRNA synthetase